MISDHYRLLSDERLARIAGEDDAAFAVLYDRYQEGFAKALAVRSPGTRTTPETHCRTHG